jgi:hypothetical protein
MTMQLSMQKIRKDKGNLVLAGINSEAILDLLKVRHSDDVFIPECKDGATWGRRDLLKLDAWVLCRSYSPLRTIGYEIKVSRSDFERDTKWEKYLELCHEFYFVCPAGLIRNHDLPGRVGLVWASKDRLFTKRKAERVEPDLKKLFNLLIYVVMARSQIVASMYERDEKPQLDMLEQKRRWVENADAKKELAFFIQGHIRRVYEHIMGIERTIAQREYEIENFRVALGKLGITWHPEESFWAESAKVEAQIRELRKTVDIATIRQMRNLAQSLSDTANTLEPMVKDG